MKSEFPEDRILDAWLTEWFVWQDLRDSLMGLEEDLVSAAPAGPVDEQVRQQFRSAIRPYAPETAKVGEVRLLSGTLTSSTDRPVYILVLEQAGDWKLVVPFGPFSVPGTPDELLLEDLEDAPADAPSGGLSVLSLREAVWVTDGQLQKSWLAGHVSEAVLQDAAAVLRSHFNGTAVPDDLRERVGVKVSPRKSDPRHTYILEEANLLAGLGGLQPIWVDETEAEASQAGKALEFAADTDIPLTLRKLFVVSEVGVEVALTWTPKSSEVTVTVFENEGPSSALNGCRIIGMGGQEVAVIQGFTAKVPRKQMGGAWGLTRPDGSPLAVKRKI